MTGRRGAGGGGSFQYPKIDELSPQSTRALIGWPNVGFRYKMTPLAHPTSFQKCELERKTKNICRPASLTL